MFQTGKVCRRSLRGVIVELLDDASSVLDDLLVGGGGILGERFDDTSDTHFLQSSPAFFVHTQVADREESDSAWGL